MFLLWATLSPINSENVPFKSSIMLFVICKTLKQTVFLRMILSHYAVVLAEVFLVKENMLIGTTNG